MALIVLVSAMDHRTPVMAQTTVKLQKRRISEFRVSLGTMGTTATQIHEQIRIVVIRLILVVVTVKALAHWIGMIVMETIEIGMRVIVSSQEARAVTLNIRWAV